MSSRIDELLVRQTGQPSASRLPYRRRPHPRLRPWAQRHHRRQARGRWRDPGWTVSLAQGPLSPGPRSRQPSTSLPVAAIAPDDGWCDSPSDPAYNRQIRLPYRASAESLWRDDHLYDVVVVLGHNDEPIVPGLGSAIFLHLATHDYAATAGCIALSARDMLDVLGGCGPTTVMTVAAK